MMVDITVGCKFETVVTSSFKMVVHVTVGSKFEMVVDVRVGCKLRR